ncbi:ABC transporter permease [Shinella zoogloeoides]|uniref:ABC transporter permease n=1 Tax=Shinella zoogloeoides TaxID=352475 RepID=UPI0028B13902|nr:ABC transporter permease [Shinella zoogloeoides]
MTTLAARNVSRRDGWWFLPPFRVFFLIVTLALVLFITIPPVALLSLSLSEQFDLVWGIFPSGISFDMYRDWGFQIFHSIGDSLRIAIPVVVLSFLIGLPVAYALARLNFPGKGLMGELISIPMVFPPIVLAFGLMQLFGNGPLGFVGPWGAIIFGHTVVAIPFMIMPLVSALHQIDPAYEDAALSLGAGRLRTVLTIVVPNVVPAIVTGMALVFARSISDFEITLLLTTPDISTMPVEIYHAFESGSTRLGAAVSVATSLFSVAIIVLIEIVVRKAKWW